MGLLVIHPLGQTGKRGKTTRYTVLQPLLVGWLTRAEQLGQTRGFTLVKVGHRPLSLTVMFTGFSQSRVEIPSEKEKPVVGNMTAALRMVAIAATAGDACYAEYPAYRHLINYRPGKVG
jgi:hypothetical protein